MKVTELRTELEARGINSTGLKPQLIAKLQKSIKAEQEEEEKKMEEAKKEKEENKEESEEGKTEEEGKDKENPEDEVMEIVTEEDKSKKKTESKIKPLDDKQKQVITAAYKMPSKISSSIKSKYI